MRRLGWLLPLLALAQPAAAADRSKIAVLALKAPPEMKAHTVKLLDELLLTEIQESGDFEVFGSSDIASMITLEEERVKLTGCADDSCLVEIGGALGVNLLVASSLGAVGEKHLVNVKLLDVSTARVLKRSTEVISGSEAELIDALKRAVKKMMGALGEGGAGGATPEPATQAEAAGDGQSLATTPGGASGAEAPVAFLDVAPWIGLGLTVALGGAGGAVLGLGQRDKSAMDDEYRGNDAWNDLKDSSETKSNAGIALLGVAGAAAVATVVLFIVGAGDDEPAAVAGVIPLERGAMATVGLGF